MTLESELNQACIHLYYYLGSIPVDYILLFIFILSVVENVRNIGMIPPAGATIIVMPIKFKDGSGGPARITAIWGQQDFVATKYNRLYNRFATKEPARSHNNATRSNKQPQPTTQPRQ